MKGLSHAYTCIHSPQALIFGSNFGPGSGLKKCSSKGRISGFPSGGSWHQHPASTEKATPGLCQHIPGCTVLVASEVVSLDFSVKSWSPSPGRTPPPQLDWLGPLEPWPVRATVLGGGFWNSGRGSWRPHPCLPPRARYFLSTYLFF